MLMFSCMSKAKINQLKTTLGEQFVGCKKRFKFSLVENCNVGMSFEQPTEIIPYALFNEFHFLLKINEIKPRFFNFWNTERPELFRKMFEARRNTIFAHETPL